MGKSIIVYCEKCGKKLLERKSNGMWHFKFGRIPNSQEPVVDILFFGSLKFKCTRKSCKHINVLNFFPDTFVQSLSGKPLEQGCADNPNTEDIDRR